MSEPRRHIRRGPTRLTVKNSGIMDYTYIKPSSNSPKSTSSNMIKRPVKVELGTEIYTEQPAKRGRSKTVRPQDPKTRHRSNHMQQRQLNEYL